MEEKGNAEKQRSETKEKRKVRGSGEGKQEKRKVRGSGEGKQEKRRMRGSGEGKQEKRKVRGSGESEQEKYEKQALLSTAILSFALNFSNKQPDDTGIMKKMYEKIMRNPAIPVLACITLYTAFSISRRRIIKSMSQAEFNRSIALVPLTAFAGTAAWYHGTSIRDQQYIRHDD